MQVFDVLRSAVALSAAPHMLTNERGSLLFANEAACTLFGRSLQELTRLSLKQLTHPDDVASDLSAVRGLAAGEYDSFSGRKRYLRADGATIWTDATTTCIRDGSGDITCLWWQIVDVDAEVQAARQSATGKELLNGLLEAEVDGHVILRAVRDADGVVEDFEYAEVNEAACRILSVSRAEVIGRRVTEVFPESMDSGRLVEYRQVVETGEPRQWKAMQVRSSVHDSARLIDAHVVKVAGGVSCVFRDVTAQVRSSQALAQSQAELQLVLEHARDVQLRANADGVIEFVSPAVRHVLGWEPADLIGKTPADFLHPDDLTMLRQAGQELREGGSPVRVGRFRRPDGSYAWIESVMSSILDGEGHLTARVASWRDVGDRVEAANRVADAERRYRLLAENSSDAVFAVTPDAVFTYVSPSVTTLLGWAPTDLVGHTPMDFLHPEDVSTMAEHFTRAGTGQPVSLRVRMRTYAGQYRWINATVRSVLDGSGGVVERIGSCRDAEAEVAAEQALSAERDRLRATLDVELDPHITLRAVRDDHGTIVDFAFVDANTAALDYMEMDADNFPGTLLTSIYSSESGRRLVAQYSHTVETGEPLIEDDYVYPNEQFGGEVRKYDLRGVKLGDGMSVAWRDVTERSAMMAALAESEQRFRLLAENSSDVVVLTDGISIQWVSPSLTTQLGWEPDQWIGRRPEELVHPEDLAHLSQSSDPALRDRSHVVRMRVLDADHSYHWVQAHYGPFRDAAGDSRGLVASFRVVDTEVQLEERLKQLAMTDSTTGLLNRREAVERLERLAEERERTGTHLAVLFCDIDRFKDINDTFGHSTADEALRQLAARITDTVGADGIVARLGGDEILIALNDVDSLDHAQKIAEGVRSAAARPITVAHQHVQTTLSIGVTVLHPGESVEALITRADVAMYAAKDAGRDRVTTLP
ncbi:MAG: PAS domain S-box protein [Actinobacteria bacterium]|nr:PAS domain S-box protein [Actinomycetota bacterium]